MDLTQLLGWFGTGLVIVSLSVSDARLFRRVNLAAAVVLLVFNLALGLWSMVAMNLVIAGIDVHHLARLRHVVRRATDDGAPAAAEPKPVPSTPWSTSTTW
jgi:hypothetical protein